MLGYADTNKAIAMHVDDEDKLNDKTASSLGQRGGWFINESGLYSLIMGSKLPSAKKFKRWVTSEVLPTIRKTGQYNIMDSYMIKDPIERAKRWIEEQEEKKALELENNVQKQQIAELQPKASYYDIVLNCEDIVTITVIAKDYGWSGTKLNKYLHEKGIQYKQNDTWLLYQPYAENGYTKTKTPHTRDKDGKEHAHVHTYWTQKGRLFIYDLLKNDGILPLIEKENK